MTAAMIANDDEAFDWRSGGACDASDADLHYVDAQELVDEHGFTTKDAKAFLSEAEEMAKAICRSCPIRSRCLNAAMANEEEFGIWGGMTVDERELYRPAYAKIRKSLGRPVVATVQKDISALHNNPGVDSRYRWRLDQAVKTLHWLMEQPATWTLDTRKWLGEAHYGVHDRDTFVQLFDLIRLHPTATNQELARGIGKSKTWFNSLTRSCRNELDAAA